MNANVKPIGLLAGSGRFPIVFAEKARQLDIPVVCVGIRQEASLDLRELVDHFRWVSIARMGGMIRCFKRHGVEQAVMAGKVQKNKLHYSKLHLLSYIPDWRTTWWYIRRVLLNRKRLNNNDDSLLMSVIDEFAREGIQFVSALDFCPELLVKSGILSKRRPTVKEESDIEFGWQIAKEMGRLDIGQSVAVKNRSVLAVEAIEGTDQCILRAGSLCRNRGFTVVKVAKPQQDRRFDVPTVGISTVESMHQAGANVLAIEAANTILIDEAETVALADRYGISVVSVERSAA